MTGTPDSVDKMFDVNNNIVVRYNETNKRNKVLIHHTVSCDSARYTELAKEAIRVMDCKDKDDDCEAVLDGEAINDSNIISATNNSLSRTVSVVAESDSVISLSNAILWNIVSSKLYLVDAFNHSSTVILSIFKIKNLRSLCQ